MGKGHSREASNSPLARAMGRHARNKLKRQCKIAPFQDHLADCKCIVGRVPSPLVTNRGETPGLRAPMARATKNR